MSTQKSRTSSDPLLDNLNRVIAGAQVTGSGRNRNKGGRLRDVLPEPMVSMFDDIGSRMDKTTDYWAELQRQQDPNSFRLPEHLRTREATKRLNTTLPTNERIKQDYNRTTGEGLLQTAGQATGALGDVTGTALTQALSVLPFSEQVGGLITDGMQAAVNSETGQDIAQLVEDNPRLAQNLGAAANVLSAVTSTGGAVKAVKPLGGNVVAGQKNYISNHYGDDFPNVPATKIEQMVGRQLVKARNQKPTKENIQKAGKMALAMPKWAADSPINVLDALFNPASRALYRETGINARNQKAVKEQLTKNDKLTPEELMDARKGGTTASSFRNLNKATAQAIYGRHMMFQGDRRGTVNPIMNKLADYAYLGTPYSPPALQTFVDNANLTVYTKGKGTKKKPTEKIEISDKDHEFAFNHMMKRMGADKDTGIVMKNVTGQSGAHSYDLAKSNPVNVFLRGVPAALKKEGLDVNMPNAWGALKKREFIETGDKKGQRRFTVLTDKDNIEADGGIWIQTGTAAAPFRGSAVVEGGVGGLTKLMPDGSTINYMLDNHDFLEKIPLLKQLLEHVLPKKVTAVSGAVVIRPKGGWSPTGETQSLPDDPYLKQVEGRMNDKEVKGMLTEYADIKPTTAGTIREIPRVAANVNAVADPDYMNEQEQQALRQERELRRSRASRSRQAKYQ